MRNSRFFSEIWMDRSHKLFWSVVLCALVFWPVLALAAAKLPGPIPATVVRVVDGDTVEVHATIWLEQTIQTKVRLSKIDTPEPACKCPQECVLATLATQATQAWVLHVGGMVDLLEVEPDAYAGRVVARVQDKSGEDLGSWLVTQGHARAYTGRRESWCEGGE